MKLIYIAGACALLYYLFKEDEDESLKENPYREYRGPREEKEFIASVKVPGGELSPAYAGDRKWVIYMIGKNRSYTDKIGEMSDEGDYYAAYSYMTKESDMFRDSDCAMRWLYDTSVSIPESRIDKYFGQRQSFRW